MSKKPNESRWSIYRIRKSPAELVGWATAKDPESALRKYLEEGKITDAREVKRLYAMPDR
jgi:hypothetical protein